MQVVFNGAVSINESFNRPLLVKCFSELWKGELRARDSEVVFKEASSASFIWELMAEEKALLRTV